ncbi:MAG: hypothetical protein IPJ77_00070 [Planctomycetes bacterium]|nr:hypothetical protein [Planctomycetota bacterium]
MRSSLFAFAALVGTAALGSIASAGVTTPGSLVVFPEFDNRVQGNNARNWTLFTLTNTNPTESVWVHIVYRNHSDIPSQDCLETNRFYRLTANDTITLLTAFDNPNRDEGFAYAYAVQSNQLPETPIKFDHLIASQMDLRGDVEDAGDGSFEFTPYIFRAGSRLAPNQATDRDGDGLRDLNGLEYEKTPDVLLVPRFFGQDADDTNTFLPGGAPRFHSELVLINLSGGRLFDATVNFLVYNDSEDVFSAQHSFRCWTRVGLSEIDGVFTNQFLRDFTNHTGNEVAGGGAEFPETGWFSIDGATADSTSTSIPDPAILALRIETDHTNRRCSGAVIPFCLGTQDNGDLYPLAQNGDTDDTP